MAKNVVQSTTVPAIIVLAGEEAFLRNEQLARIAAEVLGEGDPGMALVRLEGSASIATVLDEVRTPSMFTPKKLVIVDTADALLKGGGDDGPIPKGKRPTATNRELIEGYLETPSEFGVLVLVCESWLKSTRLHKALDKLGAVRWCESIKEQAAPGWITKRRRDAYGKQIEPAAAARLADLIGPDLARLDNELAKLSLYQPLAPAITTKAVDELVGFQHEQQIWDLINALSERNAPDALKKVDELWQLDPKIEYTAVAAVFSWLNQVVKARELIDARMPDGVVIRDLKLWPPDRAQKMLALARRWGLEGAATFSEALLRVDANNKTSVGDARRNLETFIVKLCA